MEAQHIDTAIYDMAHFNISRHRKSIVMAVIFAIIGIVSLTAGIMETQNPNTKSGLLLCGTIITISCLSVIGIRLFGNTYAPYYKPSKEVLRRREKHYPYTSLDTLKDCMQQCDYKKITTMQEVQYSNVLFIAYEGRKSGVCFCQLLTYVPHEYRPATDIVMMQKK